MKNRTVGILILGIAAVILFIIFSFNRAMTTIVSTSCSHGTSCPMWGSIDFQTNLSIAITAFIALIGLYLIFFGRDERIVTKFKAIKQQIGPDEITKGNYKKAMVELEKDERIVFEKVIEAKGSMFQSEIVDKTGFPKVKITRILDKLEGRGLVERRRRGMTNMVVLKR